MTSDESLPSPRIIQSGQHQPRERPAGKSTLSEADSQFLAVLRGVSITVIVFGHVGGFWVFKPYSEFLHVFVPAFFLISGAVCYASYQRTATVGRYLAHRAIRLLVPYFLLCILCLATFLVVNGRLPPMTLHKAFLWLSIRPTADAMGFPIGQVWFLHTLMIISLVSPVCFGLYNTKPWLLLVVATVPLALSCVQLSHDIYPHVSLLGNNLYKPVVHSVFYIFGFVYFSSAFFHTKRVLIGLLLFSSLLSVELVRRFGLNVDCSLHAFLF